MPRSVIYWSIECVIYYMNIGISLYFLCLRFPVYVEVILDHDLSHVCNHHQGMLSYQQK
ncbi:hypothetical protein BO85DRAFT_174402 [Aspergillus piperis CBS 112811]|uniref:Uncharacterized protein n=1 Tax=Aspergillus piperis CBS 112811 TaxID=1448313 RepID=A0A8G1VH00_9EURO|nr:hypothetical protein BO85DRAFT_174402 [Aspergillus piperis CBS 112811]RAH52836.1 hypothetical protein BO85DRAFT_174402 [Aspergillus piperis CBS 112811]